MSRKNRTAAARRRTAADREQRRQTLAILHARAQRGVLSTDEADRMVGIVTRELADAETLRGQVDDRRREHAAEIRRREAAEAAIVEAEEERDEAQQRAENLRANLDDYRADYIRTRRRIAAILAKPADTPLDELTEYAAKTLTRNGERLIEAEQRAEQAEAERDELHAALSLAPGQLHSAALSAIHGRGANIRELAARADTAEQRLARIRDMADNWERRLPATIRTATAAEAVRNAANGDDRPVMFAVTPAPAAPPVPDAYRAPAGDPRAVLDRIRDARQWSDVQAQLGMYYGWTAEQSGQRARAYRLAADSLTAAAEQHADEERQRAEHVEAELAATVKAKQENDERFQIAAAEQRQRAEQAEQQLADVRKAYRDLDAVATLRGVQLEQARNVARHVAERADRYHAAWRNARKRAKHHADEHDYARNLHNDLVGDYRRLTDRLSTANTTLRDTENDLADARRRLAERAEPCPGPDTVLRPHPVYDVIEHLTAAEPLAKGDALDLVKRYHDGIHDRYCTRQHGETP